MGIVPEGTGAVGGATAGRQRPVPPGRVRARRPRHARRRLPDYYAGAPEEQRAAVPDRARRNDARAGAAEGIGRSRRQRSLAGHGPRPRGTRRARRDATAPGTDYAYIGFNLRDPALADRAGAAGDRVCHRSRRTSSITCGAGWRVRRPASCRRCPGRSRRTRSSSRTIRRAPARCWTRRAIATRTATARPPRLRLTLKTSTDERYRTAGGRHPAAIWREVGIALDVRSYEFATLMSDVIRGNVQLYTLQYVGVTDPDMLRRAFHSSQMPPDGFNRGHYANPEVDRADRRRDVIAGRIRARAALSGSAAPRSPPTCPYISLWAKTNVAVAQPDAARHDALAHRGFSVSERRQPGAVINGESIYHVGLVAHVESLFIGAT